MSLAQALQTTALTLSLYGIEESHHEARILLQHILNLSSAELYSQLDSTLSRAKIRRLHQLVKCRIRRKPNAYIVRNKEFYGTDFYVDQRVLIPRPETELLVEAALAFVKDEKGSPCFFEETPVIADIGTGCGAIAISLALNLPDCKIYATDISSAALKVARTNCEHHKVTEQIHLLRGNLLEPLPEKIDLIVANLPYIRSSDLSGLEPEVVNFEPRIALDGGRDGLKHIHYLIVQAKNKIHPQGCILLEIGDKQDSEILTIAKRYLPAAHCELLSDLDGINRVVKIAL